MLQVQIKSLFIRKSEEADKLTPDFYVDFVILEHYTETDYITHCKVQCLYLNVLFLVLAETARGRGEKEKGVGPAFEV